MTVRRDMCHYRDTLTPAPGICKNPARACDYEAHVKLPKELLQYVPAPEGYDQVELFRAWADNRDDKYVLCLSGGRLFSPVLCVQLTTSKLRGAQQGDEWNAVCNW